MKSSSQTPGPAPLLIDGPEMRQISRKSSSMQWPGWAGSEWRRARMGIFVLIVLLSIEKTIYQLKIKNNNRGYDVEYHAGEHLCKPIFLFLFLFQWLNCHFILFFFFYMYSIWLLEWLMSKVFINCTHKTWHILLINNLFSFLFFSIYRPHVKVIITIMCYISICLAYQ